ncbi:hypothetical protein AB0C02_27985 [Micromonospora sp. NPDC048999]|uniref:hypothetical protein n=1 Tax=Micromonospora sp. NPDC048999 TaxID=3155391 RepID=UPI0033F23022
MTAMNDDIVIACVDLAGRAGASGVDIGYINAARWYAVATYRGARIIVDGHGSPTAAALALAERLLSRAKCRCTQPVTLSDARPGCRWRLVGRRWEPGCDAAPITVAAGGRGDLAAIERAMALVPPGGNRAARRKAKRRRP